MLVSLCKDASEELAKEGDRMTNKAALIVDIDKTITSKDHFSNKTYIPKCKELYDKMADDTIPTDMRDLLVSAGEFHDLVFITGRDIDFKECTEKFLKKNLGETRFEVRYCKPFESYQKYVEEKTEMVVRYIGEKRHVFYFVIDDDAGVIENINKQDFDGAPVWTYQFPENFVEFHDDVSIYLEC